MILALVCMIYLGIPGVIVLMLPCAMKQSRAVVAVLFALALTLEMGVLSYLQAHPIVESKEIPVAVALTIVREARDQGFTVDNHGKFELGDYVFLVKYRLYRNQGWDDLGTLQVLGWPFGENRTTVKLERLGGIPLP